MAQFHNLDRLVAQTEKLTATTETIKARLSYEMWDQQMRWTAKRDSYISLMETLGERHDVEARNKLLEQIRRREPNNQLYPIERDRALLRSQEVQTRFGESGVHRSATCQRRRSPDPYGRECRPSEGKL